MSGYSARSYVVKHLEDIKQEWTDLQEAADCSYFQSWGWIESWLDQIAIDLLPIVVKVQLNSRLVGVALFVCRDIKRRFIFHSNAMLLNEYPFDGKNMVIEYNGVLAERGHEEAATIAVVRHLVDKYRDYDEFFFGAIVADLFPVGAVKQSVDGVNCIINEESTSWYVDLESFSSGIDAYLATLSRNRRGQIRRSIKLYNQDGTMKIEEAQDTEQALLYFNCLRELHSEYWQTKGKPGSFANPAWKEFHDALIRRRFDDGDIQLLKVSNSSGDIGYLYNLVFKTHVYVMQTGFRCSENKRQMPGYVTHAMAIAHNKSKGMMVYDLMHGDDQYKRILCNRSLKLQWVVLQRKRLKFAVETCVLSMVRCVRSYS